jgi:hypothetical protein
MESGLSVAARAASALEGVERAIETTTSVAEELAEREQAQQLDALLDRFIVGERAAPRLEPQVALPG